MPDFTCRDVVSRALRMVGIVGRSEDAEADELRDGMIVLQSLYDGWLVNGMFGKLTDVNDDVGYDARPGQRITSTGAVTLPIYTDEICPWHDLAAIEIFDVAGRRAYVWDRNAWVRLDSLEPSDEAPLSARSPNGLAACLAVLYAEEFGGQPTAAAMRQCMVFKSALSFKFGSTQEPVEGQWF